MCRWLAYSGGPIALSRLVLEQRRSLIDQSLSASSGTTTTNGDGFGIGWYDALPTPGLYRDTQPAWNDANLRDLCTHIRSPMFLAHVRSATASLATQQTNCHPFRHGKWLFMHNGEIHEFSKVRRDLWLSVAPELFSHIAGTTDSELMFYLALSLGLADDVGGAVARMVGLVEDVGRRHGVEHPVRMTLGIADGERLHAFRYGSSGSSPSLYQSRAVRTLREIVPPEHHHSFAGFTDDARAIVSEPLTDLQSPWEEIPESSYVTVHQGEVTTNAFKPERPRP